ncbi:MAG TPA: TetR/AcrR family transcriptional regulator [Casimicrobiaceae bacterium]|nr:TetR/AcrR family transcriptional regulator [Casimicrobiaceae bacterium]
MSSRRTDSRKVSSRRGGGRPSRARSVELGERILDIATDEFLTHGYGATSIGAIAARAQISKRTFYHRFHDKPALFGAVVHRIIERLRPPADIPLIEGTDLRQILQRLAAIILRAALSAQALALHRLIIAESARFPRLAAVVAQQGGTEEAVRLIAGQLARGVRTGKLDGDASTFAAQQFLYMVIALPQRRAIGLGKPMTSSEIDHWARDVVDLFLTGWRGWSGAL